MALFSKLRERLFKSSSRLEEGLDAIVEEGGEETPVEAPQPEKAQPQPEAPVAEAAPAAPEAPAPVEPEKPTRSLLSRLTGAAPAKPVVRRELDDDLPDERRPRDANTPRPWLMRTMGERERE